MIYFKQLRETEELITKANSSSDVKLHNRYKLTGISHLTKINYPNVYQKIILHNLKLHWVINSLGTWLSSTQYVLTSSESNH